MRVAGRQQAAAGAVEVARNVQPAQQLDGLHVAARLPDLLPVQDGRTFGIDQDVGQFLDVARIAHRTGRCAVVPGLRYHGLGDVHFPVEHVSGNFEVCRARCAVERLPDGHRDHVRDPLGGRHGRRELGDGSHDVHVRQVLQRSHLVLGERALAADVQDRTLRAERRRNAGDRVGAARARGMRRHLLVTHVDDAYAFIDATVVDVDDVAAAEREDRVHSLVLQRLGDEVATGDHACIAILRFQRVLRGGAGTLGGRPCFDTHGCTLGLGWLSWLRIAGARAGASLQPGGRFMRRWRPSHRHRPVAGWPRSDAGASV